MQNPRVKAAFGCWLMVISLALLSACSGVIEGGEGPAAQGSSGSSKATSGSGTTQSQNDNAMCGSGRAACGATCVDLQTDSKNCGTCDTACPGACVAGKCQCSNGQTSCGGACVDLTTDAHCGSCDNACSTGQSCNGGGCHCAGTAIACNSICTDTQTSIDHCGGCNKPCDQGQTCSGGMCMCPAGQATCTGKCIDLTQSETDCGACGKACATGQVCSGGACVSASDRRLLRSGAGHYVEADRGLPIRQIPIMDAGAEVPSAKRNASVVSGRSTMFRLFPTLDTGFAAREIFGAHHADQRRNCRPVFAKHSLSKSAVETDTTTTFEVVVPAEKVTVDTTYHAELVECGTGSGQAHTPRFPASGELGLGVRLTGGLKVKLIPILANSAVPDTSDTALTVYKQMLMAMYPIDAVEITVGTQLSVKYPIDWSGTLDQNPKQKSKPRPRPQTFITFAYLKPEDTLDYTAGTLAPPVSATFRRGALRRRNVLPWELGSAIAFLPRRWRTRSGTTTGAITRLVSREAPSRVLLTPSTPTAAASSDRGATTQHQGTTPSRQEQRHHGVLQQQVD